MRPNARFGLFFVFATVLIASFAFVPPAYAPKPPPPPTTYYVAPTGSGGGSCKNPNYNAIQTAVTSVPANSKIIVCPGTYTEQVAISKSLTLVGSGPSSATIRLPRGLVQVDVFGYVNIVTITGSGVSVEISGFTISGPGLSTCDPGTPNSGPGLFRLDAGIFVQGNAYANIHDNAVVHIRNDPFDSCQAGVGIMVGHRIINTVGTATIKKNTVSDYQSAGILVDFAGSSAIVTQNTVTGVGETTIKSQNGIQVSRGATATVSQNIVSNNECDYDSHQILPCGPDLINQDQSVGILIGSTTSATTVSKNTVTANDVGILLWVTANSVSASYNTISATRLSSIFLFDLSNNAIMSNTIVTYTPNTAPCPSLCYTSGIDVLSDNSPSSTGNVISSNSVTVPDQYALVLSPYTSGNIVTKNSFTANGGTSHGNAAVLDQSGLNAISKNN